MLSHPLFDALVQPSQPLPAHFRQAGVGMPPKLPKLLRYGPVAPPQVGGSQFTGGRVAQPQSSMAHPQAAQGFTPPHYNAANPTAPSLAPFVQTQQGGQPTGPPFNVARDPTGATPPPPTVQQGTFSPYPAQQGTFVPPPSETSGLGGPLHQGGYDNTAQVLASLLGLGPPSPTVSAAPPTRTGGYYQAPSILQTLLAQQGQRLNPSGGTRYAQ